MGKKKIIGMVLAVLLLLSSGGQARAADSITASQAISSLQKAFPDLTRGKTFQANLESDRGWGEAVWVLVWAPDGRSADYQGYSNLPGITAEVKADNSEVVSLSYRPDPQVMAAQPVTLSKEQAYPLAWQVVNRLHGEKVADLQYREELDYQQYYGGAMVTAYSFVWSRILDGKPIDNDLVSVGIDARDGALISYRYTWHDKVLPELGPTVSVSEVTDAALTDLGMHPAYINDPRTAYQDTIPQLIPVYFLNTAYAYVDAHSGKWLNYDGSEATGDLRKVNGAFAYTPGIVEATPAYNQQFIKPETAQKVAEDFFRSLGKAGPVRRSGSGSSIGPGYRQTTWNYSLDANLMRSSDGWTDVSIDAYTGEIAGFHRDVSSGQTSGNNGITYERAAQNARDMIGWLNPEKQDTVTLRNSNTYGNRDDAYSFMFIRLIHGIPYEDNGINVVVHKQTGLVTDYYVRWSPVRVMDESIKVTLEQAADIFKAKQPWKLSYVFPRNERGQEVNTGMAVYQLQEKSAVDALTGELIAPYRYPNASPANQPPQKEFSGYAAPALSLLRQNGLLPEGSIAPENPVTRRQALAVIVAATRSSTSYGQESAVKLNLQDIKAGDLDAGVFIKAVNLGIIANQGNFEPERTLTREELAVWLVKGLGYEQVARMKNQIMLPYKDAEELLPERRNFVGIACGLDLMSGDQQGFFNPRQAVTWADLAIAGTRAAAQAQIINQRSR